MSLPDNDMYEILGLEPGASWDEIKTAYRRLAKKHHPDRNPGDAASEYWFKQVNQAYEGLREIHRIQDDDVAPKPSRRSPEQRCDRQDREPRKRARSEGWREQASKGGGRGSKQGLATRSETAPNRRPKDARTDRQDRRRTRGTGVAARTMLIAFLLLVIAMVFMGYPQIQEPDADDHGRSFLDDYDRERRIEGLSDATRHLLEQAERQRRRDRIAPVSGWQKRDKPDADPPHDREWMRSFLRDHEAERQSSRDSMERTTDTRDVLSDRDSVQLEGQRTGNSDASVTRLDYFTRGSHEDDVERIQGTPTRIEGHSALGYEDWYYGWNTVTISTATRRVTEWSNSNGALRVRMVPGENKGGGKEASATLGRSS